MRFNLPEGVDEAYVSVVRGSVWAVNKRECSVPIAQRLETQLYWMADLELGVCANGAFTVTKNNRICHISRDCVQQLIEAATWL